MTTLGGRVLVVIPAFNEASRVGQVVRRTSARHDQFDVLVVDDASEDETAAEATAAGAMVLPLPDNLGYGHAIQAGYRWALRAGYDAVVQLDADGQHASDEIAAVVNPILTDRADVVVGSRFLMGTPQGMPLSRRLGNRVFGVIASLIARRRFTDSTSGFQALNRRALKWACQLTYPHDYPDANILVLVHKSGLRLVEVPVSSIERPSGTSMHGGIRSLYYVYRMSLALVMTLRSVPRVSEVPR